MRLRVWAALGCLLALLLIPTPGIGLFDGLPLDHWPEFAAFCIVLPALFWPRLRSGMAAAATLRGRSLLPVLIGLALVAVVAKGVLFAAGEHGGFWACYRSTIVAPRVGNCELSFDNPFRIQGATRFDDALDFPEQPRWPVGFFNDDRFDYRSLVPGMPSRDHLPFKVRWSGWVETPVQEEVRIQYVGEGKLSLGDQVIDMPPRYGTGYGDITVRVPPGRHRLTADYRFDDNFGVGLSQITSKSAALVVEARPAGVTPGPGWRDLRSADPPQNARLLGWLASVTVLLLLLLIGLAYWRESRWGVLAAGVLVLGGATAFLYEVDPVARAWVLSEVPGAMTLSPAETFELAFAIPGAALTLAVALTRGGGLAGGWLGACALGPWAVLAWGGAAVRVRSFGDDHLRYESFAREILATWRPLAGEYVFQYAPIYRYVKFTEHLLFGDADQVYSAFAVAVLIFIPAWLLVRLRPAGSRWLGVVGALSAVTLALLVTNPMIYYVIFEGLSEYPAWAGLLLAVGLLAGPGRPRPILAAICLAVAVGVRSNFLFGAMLITLLELPAIMRLPVRAWATAFAAGLAILLVPLVHNLYYGGEFAPFTTLNNAAGNQAIPLGGLLHLGSDPALRAILREQLDLIFVIRPATTSWLTADRLVWLVQAGFAASAVALAAAALVRARRAGRLMLAPWALAPLALPLVFLAVLAIYWVTIYYPRHIIVLYLAAPAAIMWAAWRLSRVSAPA